MSSSKIVMLNIFRSPIFYLVILLNISCVEKHQSQSKVQQEVKDTIDILDTIQIVVKSKKEKTIKSTKKNTNTLPSQENKKCNLETLARLYKNIDSPSRDMIEEFLLTFDSTCKSNVEYTEFSNELLFLVLNSAPEKTIEILAKNGDLDTTTIFNSLQSPIDDTINIDELINKINGVSGYDDLRIELKQILKRILSKG